MVEESLELEIDVTGRYAIGENIMCGLEVEGLFDFCVGSHEKVENDEYGKEEQQQLPWLKPDHGEQYQNTSKW